MAKTGTKPIPEKARHHLFGPVFSRRLGLSLGVDMVPYKTCTYDCLYCEVGPTTNLTVQPQGLLDPGPIITEIEDALRSQSPDVLTFGGSGEPTLNSHLFEILRHVKKRFQIKTALLTNGILFLREDVRKVLPYLDLILPTMSTGFPETFRRLHRPHSGLSHEMLKEAIRAIKRDFRGEIWVEVLLVEGINDGREEWKEIARFLSEIGPERIQVGTVERPPAYRMAKPVPERTLKEACLLLGKGAELILPRVYKAQGTVIDKDVLLDTLRRRPLTAEELTYWAEEGGIAGFNSLEELVLGLRLKKIKAGDVEFYTLKEEG